MLRAVPLGKPSAGSLRSCTEGPTKVLNLKSGRKLRTIVELAQFFMDRGVETTTDLWSWLQGAGNPSLLMTVHGVGPKTVSFLKLLVGLDAIAVDRQVLRFVQEAGVYFCEGPRPCRGYSHESWKATRPIRGTGWSARVEVHGSTGP